jgi:tRNA(Ile)-lysidine synthetase-like protein
MHQPGEIPSRLLRAGRSPLAATLLRCIEEHSQDSSDRESCLLAVSGGHDSLPLLWLGGALAQHASHHRVVVAHVNHGLRAEAASEADLVVAHARDAGLECVVESIDCRGDGNLASIARLRRQDALLQIARTCGCGLVATAHHADDQLETVLAALARGAGPRGWRGIHACRPLADDVLLVRPFLTTPGAALRQLGRELGLAPSDDPTNRDPRRLRGRLRQGVCRELEAIFPGASRRVAAAAEHAELAGQAIDRWLDEVWGDPAGRTRPRPPLRSLPPLLVAAGLRRSLLALAPGLADRVTEAMCRQVAESVCDGEQVPRRWMWPDGFVVELTSERLSLRPFEAPSQGRSTSDRTRAPGRTPPPPAASPRR